MPPEEIRSYLRAVPFVPFRLHLTDGRHLDVYHPETLLLTSRSAIVGVWGAGGSVFPDYSETVALIHVVSIEPMPQMSGSQTNGQ